MDLYVTIKALFAFMVELFLTVHALKLGHSLYKFLADRSSVNTSRPRGWAKAMLRRYLN
jgi:hypothetical protein